MQYMDTHPSWLRPYSVGEIIDISFKLYKSMFGQMVKAVAVIAVPAAILEGLLTISAIPHGFFSHGLTGFAYSPAAGQEVPTIAMSSNLQQAASLINDILGFAVSGLVSAACFKLVAGAYLSVQPDWRASISFGLKRLHSVLWTTLESTVIPFLPLVAVILGAVIAGTRSLSAGVIIGIALGLPSLAVLVWLWVAWRLNVISLIAEGAKGRHALGRSLFLVEGRWWPSFGVQILMQLIIGIIGGIISIPFGLGGITMLVGGHTATGILLTVIGGAVGNILLMPLLASMLAVLYFDLRVRKEGLDLAIIASELGIKGLGDFAMPEAPGFTPPATYPPYQQYPYPQQYPQYPYPPQYQQPYPEQPYPQQYPQYPPEDITRQEPPGYFKPPSDPPSGYLPPPFAGNYPPPATRPGQTAPDMPGITQPPPATQMEDRGNMGTSPKGEDTWPAETQPPDLT